MIYENIPVKQKTKETLNKHYHNLKEKKLIKNWDDFINLLFKKYQIKK